MKTEQVSTTGGPLSEVHLMISYAQDTKAFNVECTSMEKIQPCGVTLTITSVTPEGEQRNSIRVQGTARINVKRKGIAVHAEITLSDLLNAIMHNSPDLGQKKGNVTND